LIEKVYNDSSIFLSPSCSEGFGLPAAEAAACGCAVVATQNGGIQEYLEHGVTGLLSPPKDPETLAENLCLLLGNEDLRVRLAKACNTVVAGLSWERSTDLLEEFIEGVVRPRDADLREVSPGMNQRKNQ
jgi:glycosyltransferase involved in cell wall biosynthesis